MASRLLPYLSSLVPVASQDEHQLSSVATEMAVEHEHQRRVAARSESTVSIRELGAALASEPEEERANGLLPALASTQDRDYDRARTGRPSHEESRPQSASSAVNSGDNDPDNSHSDKRASWILELKPQETEDSKYLRRDLNIEDTPVDRMRHLWIKHTDIMEKNSKAFLRQVDERQARTIANIANLQGARFDLAVVLTVLQEHCQYLKEHVLENYRDVRQREGRFLRDLYMLARREYEQGIQKILDAEEAKHRAQVKALQQQHASDVDRERSDQAAGLESILCMEGDAIVNTLASAFEEEQRALHAKLARVRAGSEKVLGELAATRAALAGFEKERAMMSRASELLEIWKDRYHHDAARITALEKELRQANRQKHARISKMAADQAAEAKKQATETERYQREIRMLEAGLRSLLDATFSGGWAGTQADTFLQHHKLPYLTQSFTLKPIFGTYAAGSYSADRSLPGSPMAAASSARDPGGQRLVSAAPGLSVAVPSLSSRSSSRGFVT